MPLTFLTGITVKKQLYHNEYLYYRQRKNYWICIEKECGVTISTNGESENDNVTREPKRVHTHDKVSAKNFKCLEIKQEMKESITKQSSKFSSVVYKEGIKSLTQTGINHEEIAEMMPSFDKLRGTLNAGKAKKYGKLPKILTDINFEDERFIDYISTIDQQPFFRFDNKHPTNRIVIFISDIGLSILANPERIHGDGTFEASTDLFYQLYILHGYVYNKMFPAAYVLLKRKDYETYCELIKFIKELASKKTLR